MELSVSYTVKCHDYEATRAKRHSKVKEWIRCLMQQRSLRGEGRKRRVQRTRRRDETRFADLFATPQMRVISAKHSAIGRTGPPATLDIHFVLHAYLHDPHLAQPLQKACLLDLGYYCTELKLRAPQPTDNANSNHTSEWGRYTF